MMSHSLISRPFLSIILCHPPTLPQAFWYIFNTFLSTTPTKVRVVVHLSHHLLETKKFERAPERDSKFSNKNNFYQVLRLNKGVVQ